MICKSIAKDTVREQSGRGLWPWGIGTASLLTGFVIGIIWLISFSPNRSQVVLPNGLIYRDLIIGTGPMPRRGQKLTTRYVGKLSDGTVFDSSDKTGRPYEFRIGLGQVIKGWEVGLMSMRVGGRRELIVPGHLAYGNLVRPGIPANSTLIFEVELLSITDACEAQLRRWESNPPRIDK